MKARVKATGEIVSLKEGVQIIFKDGSIGLGFRTDNGEILSDYELDFKDITQEEFDVKEKSFPKDEPDYWDKLHHQAIIATLQGILSNPEQIALYDIDCVAQAVRMADLLINKLKEDSQCEK